MNTPNDPSANRAGLLFLRALKARFGIRVGKARDSDIDDALRTGVEMDGPRLWVLMFAIIIASIGLNVNSPAVVIGAMLISPLMGPVMGIGYGVGINDFGLIRASLKNLGIAALLALLASAAYFAATPLDTPHSELISRTTPSLWDVLVAFFGGLAGIFAVTHKEKWTVIPGAAIATALMPPLCTAGYGLALGNWPFFFGALYLFTINCVFIATASAIVVTAFRLPHKQFVTASAAHRMRLWLTLGVILTLLPSLYLAYRLVEAEIFRSRAEQFVRQQLQAHKGHVVALHIDPKSRQIEVTLVGEPVPVEIIETISRQLPQQGLPGAELKVFQSADRPVDVTALKISMLADLYRDSQLALSKKEEQLDLLRKELDAKKDIQQRFADIPAELHALYPQIQHVLLSDTPDWSATRGWTQEHAVLVSLRTSRALTPGERRKIEQWLQARLKVRTIKLFAEVQGKTS
ncbi:MAG: DUF389 domain-containing protein [Gammaproteobacteria bacterium]|nr:DUF389 domain-containing protein [Gammaproteobacteria bacterium]